MGHQASVFEFSSYQFEPQKKRVVFHYTTKFENREPLFFTETITLPAIPDLKNIPPKVVEKFLQSLHLALGISYYKFYCPPTVAFAKEGATLSKSEADFWNTVYKNGLGEFYYKNNLDPKISPKFPLSKTAKTIPYALNAKPSRSLVGIGGGKDSIVVAELLKEQGFDFDTFFVETAQASPLIEKIVETIGVGNLKIERRLDEKVFQKHAYNGHVPISAIYAFLGLFSAVLYGYSHVIVGNEHSSNFGSTHYKGLEINHQWSKSYEFESLLQSYVKNFITPDVFYFSLLRSFYEIRIVKMFASYKKYFPYFSSCNKNFKIKNVNSGGLWCGQCAKCVFVFTLLSAFLSKKELLDIFHKNLYQDEKLLPLFSDVLGFGNMKPFDCVGTFEEAQTALKIAESKFKNAFIIREFGTRAKTSQQVFQTNKENSIPEPFKILGMEKVLILGFGKEGKITKQYLKQQYPKLKIGIGDMALDKNYLEKQNLYDIAVKSPGIKKELVTIPYTTATNIFFSKIKGQNTIIGITGSKGKSTTSSLIYHILKTAGKDVVLLGNIGTPMLGDLLHPIPKNRLFVLELSSAQLDDIKFSPDIAVVTNLFPEHMDYHGNLKNYYAAKKNIINFQTGKDFFVHDKKTASWLKGYIGKPILFSQKEFKSNLIGEHNKSNIGAAVAVAEILNIPQETIQKAVKSFKGLPHRLENVGTHKGITFYDDAISTTPDSTILAIQSLPNIGTIFLGGQDRGYDFIQLEKTLKKYNIKNVVAFPDNGSKMIKNIKGLNVFKTNNMKEAVTFAYKNTPKGSICLLSCASPSYSVWKNFEEKGDLFKKFVKKLGR